MTDMIHNDELDALVVALRARDHVTCTRAADAIDRLRGELEAERNRSSHECQAVLDAATERAERAESDRDVCVSEIAKWARSSGDWQARAERAERERDAFAARAVKRERERLRWMVADVAAGYETQQGIYEAIDCVGPTHGETMDIAALVADLRAGKAG